MENRILILAPHGRDAQVIQSVLQGQAFSTVVCQDPAAVLFELEKEAAAAIVTEEVLAGGFDDALGSYLQRQPAWSDFPFVVLAMRQAGRRSIRASASLQELGNLVLLERPVNPETLVSAATSALRARKRQYATRRHLQAIEAAKQKVDELNVQLESRIATRTSDLASANDRLTREIAERERLEANTVQSQKLEAIGRLTGGIAHDFNNLLSAANLSLQLITRLAPEGRISDLAHRAKRSIQRGARLTAQLLSFARAQSLLPQRHEVNALVADVRELLETSVGSKIQVQFQPCADELWVMLDGGQLDMALLNMAVNSRDAMAGGGTLTIKTALVDESGKSRQVVLSVRDTGTGIPAALLPKVFDPFFTTKADGEGTGLGLSQVYGFARQSGGTVEIRSVPNEGTTVELRFPWLETSQLSVHSVPPGGLSDAGKPAGKRAEVLVVEDEADVRDGIVEGLRLLQYVVREAADGPSGLDELRRRKPDLMMVDYLMPGMNGAEVVSAARSIYPDMPIVVASGYADMDKIEKIVNAGHVLRKPFDLETLDKAVRLALPPSS